MKCLRFQRNDCTPLFLSSCTAVLFASSVVTRDVTVLSVSHRGDKSVFYVIMDNGFMTVSSRRSPGPKAVVSFSHSKPE